MHDPMTVAFEIRIGKKVKKDGNYRSPIITIWHKDPCADGSDDSCGWFQRSRHGSLELMKKIKSEIELGFDSTFKGEDGTVYYTGYFSPKSGMPNYSTQGIVLDMFSKAAWVFFGYNRKKYKKWMKDNLFDILHFAENNTDSLKDEVVGTFRIGTGTPWNREEALNHYSSIIYAWLLRSTRPWYKHPKWHIHHWHIVFHPWGTFKRRFILKCSKCGKRGFKSSPMSNWEGTERWHQECDERGLKNGKL